MTQAYPDASVLISAFTEEVATEFADAWFQARGIGDLVTSHWCLTEIASALAAKVRGGALIAAERPRLLGQIRDILTRSATVVAVEQRHFEAAADLLGRCNLPLRGGDALHLAIAHSTGATLVTLDRRMAEAGIALGLDAHLLA